MKRDALFLQSPQKLVETEHPYAELLARGNREFETPPDETEHFCRTRADLRPRPRREVPVLLSVAVAAAALVALALGMAVRPPRISRNLGDGDAPLRTSATPFATAQTRGDPLLPQSPASELVAGERKLGDGSVVNLSPGGSARLRDRGKRTSIELDRGKVTLAVEHRPPQAELEVHAGSYRFEVIGTRFSVTRSGDAVLLRVDEGRVAVFDAKEKIAIVSAGGDWTSAESTPPPPVPDETGKREPGPSETGARSTKANAEPALDCRELARNGEPRRAEGCYLARSAGSGLDAETALLEVARLRRDVLNDPAGSLKALESYRKRFPNGTLYREADIAHVVLLARLGRSSEALVESQRLLDSPNGRERAYELRMLRGSVYRKTLGNVALAAQEFTQAEALEGANSEATYFLGLCREELGDAQGAAAAYRRYLERSPTGKRASEVRERLGRSSP